MKKLFGLALASAVAGLCVAAVKKDKTKQQAPALELPIVPSKPDHSKKAILVVSFGTSYEETREKTIGAIEEDFRRAFPDFEVRRAFTSGMIIRKLKERDGIEIDSVKQALQKLFDEGFGTVICQPTHVMNGFEFDDVRKEVDSWKGRFANIVCGWPLLTSFEDYPKVTRALREEFSDIQPGTALVLRVTAPNTCKAPTLLWLPPKAEGCKNFFIGTVEGYPDLETVKKEVEAIHAKKVVLAPLMVVAGDHAINDMSGDDDSWQQVFEAAGYETQVVLKGLGEYPSIRKIYLEHCVDCMQKLSGEISL